jgi:hypothetical protein
MSNQEAYEEYMKTDIPKDYFRVEQPSYTAKPVFEPPSAAALLVAALDIIDDLINLVEDGSSGPEHKEWYLGRAYQFLQLYGDGTQQNGIVDA